MIAIDTNSLVVLIVGLINPSLFQSHPRTSIYNEDDFNDLITLIGNLENLVILPNVWTELDNLLNKFTGTLKSDYVESVKKMLKKSTEKYIKSEIIFSYENYFYDLGFTDTILLECSKNCNLLITNDSMLSDYAKAFGIKVYDIVEEKNKKFRK